MKLQKNQTAVITLANQIQEKIANQEPNLWENATNQVTVELNF